MSHSAQRKSGDHLAGMREFPGGKIEPGETPEACLGRELKEEFNIHVAVGQYLGSNVHHYDHISIELMAFRASRGNGTAILSPEFDTNDLISKCIDPGTEYKIRIINDDHRKYIEYHRAVGFKRDLTQNTAQEPNAKRSNKNPI